MGSAASRPGPRRSRSPPSPWPRGSCSISMRPSPRNEPMNPGHHFHSAARTQAARRWFFRQCGVGLGSIALGTLLQDLVGPRAWGGEGPPDPLAPKLPHFAAKAKRVIYLFQAGAPSHLELFDYKSELVKWDGKLPPAELLKG